MGEKLVDGGVQGGRAASPWRPVLAQRSRFLPIALLLLLLLAGWGRKEEGRGVAAAGVPAGALGVCARSPLCARPSGNPRELLLRYCNPVSAYLWRLYARGVRDPLRWLSGRAACSVNSAESSCVSASAGAGDQGYGKGLPFAADPALRAHVLRELEGMLAGRLRGQPHVPGPLLQAVRHKLHHPADPAVLHLAGDNGVGKTFTARLVARALSRRCGDAACETGDALLTISGAGFDGLPLEAARRDVVGRVVRHLRDFPYGVVLIDDLTAMEPGLVAALAPLFGRGTHFPEQLFPGYGAAPGQRVAGADPASSTPPVSQLLVFITTDLGKQGRTMGKSLQQIEQMMRSSFTELYGTLLPAYTHTFPYLPFNAHTAEEVVRGAVAELPCELSDSVYKNAVVASTIDENAVSFLVQKMRPEWDGKENAHALKRMTNRLRAEVFEYLEKHGIDRRIIVRFVLDEHAMEVKMQVENSNKGSGEDL